MSKIGKINKAASVINSVLIICDAICSAVWVATAVKMRAASAVYWWLFMPLIFIDGAVASFFIAKSFRKKGALAQATTLHIAASAVSVWDVIFANLYFVGVLDLSRSLDIDKGISLSIVVFFYILDLICFLSSKDYTQFVNLDSFENNEKLRRKYGVIGGISLAVSNTVMLLISLFVSSVAVSLATCAVNLAVVYVSMAIAVKKYGEKNYYL